MKRITLLALGALFLAYGCSNSSSDDASKTATPAPTPKATADNTAPAGGGSKDVPATLPHGTWADASKILTTNCSKCHNGPTPKGGFDPADKAKVAALVTAGDPTASKLGQVLRGRGAKQMPPGKPLAEADITTVEGWIKDGAKTE